MKTMKTNKIKLAAYHEAGHALIYHILGQKIKYIAIEESGDGFCAIEYGYKPSHYVTSDKSTLEKEMSYWGLKCLSGYVSEFKISDRMLNFRVYCEGFQLKDDVGPQTDFEDLLYEVKNVNNILGEECFGLESLCSVWGATINIIHEPDSWKAIKMLSTAILSSRDNYLQGSVVHGILDKFDFSKLNLNPLSPSGL